MCVSENANATNTISSTCNTFIKLLMLANDDKGFVLLYGFCVPTEQPPYPWRFRDVKQSKQSVWSAILTQQDAALFFQELTQNGQIALGKKTFASPEFVIRQAVLSNDGTNHTAGPVSGFCHVSEYWNIHKKALFQDIKSALCADGRELYLRMQELLAWLKEECGIDFSKNGSRIGNLECFSFPLSEEFFKIETHKECGLKQTTILKRLPFSEDVIVNCTAEHRGRSVSNQTKIFRAEESKLDFFADEAMSRVIVQIWEKESGKLLFSKVITLILDVSFSMNFGSPTYHIHDSWSDQLFKSAANRSEIIKKEISAVSRTTQDRAVTIKSSTHEAIDTAMQEGQSLFSNYKETPSKGAFIHNAQKDGEIDSFIKIREYLENPSVKKVIIADPYFSIFAAQKLLARIPRTDIEIEIISSLTDVDPDTSEKIDVLQTHRKFLTENASILHQNLTIRNLSRGGKPVFHDRYLIRFFDNGQIDGYLLSNSLNSMGQFYPFVIAPMEKTVCYEVCDYLNDLCSPEVQATKSKGQRITCEVLCDYNKKTSAPQTALKERLPFASWLPPQCVSGDEPNIKTEDLSCAVAALWSHWDDARMLSCKMLSTLGSKTHPWSAKDVAAELKAIDGAVTKFLTEFIQLVEEIEEQQNHLERGLNSERYTLWALLNGQAKPRRGGFSQVFDQAGHIWYSGNSWLHGGYTLLLWLDESKYIDLLEQIKSPLMFDVLATRMLFYPWSESLYFSAANSSNLCIRLLCPEYLFYQLSENKGTFSKIKHSLEALSPNARALQLSYVLSDLVFHVRTSRVIKLKKDEIKEISDWLIKMLSNDLPICTDGEQKLALFWLHDCEVCSNCKLHLALAETVNDPEIKTRIYSEVVSEAGRDLTKADYERDISENVTLFLIAVDNLYGEDAEKELLKGIIDWHVFETATEPALKNYAFSKWHKACILAQRQIYILEIFVSHHPSATKAKEWLKEWKPRLHDMENDCE